MDILFFLLSACAFIAALVLVILLVVFAIQKNPIKKLGIWTISTFAASIIFMAVALTVSPSPATQEAVSKNVTQNSNVPGNNEVKITPKPTQTPKNTQFVPGDTFTFDNLEITIGTEIGWDTVKNQFSDLNGRDVIRVPATVKNIGDETHGLNMFYYTMYGAKGAELSLVGSYFDDSISDAGDMRPGGSQTAYFYMLYDGNGDYFIEFNNYKTKLEVKIPVAK
nr:MAG TPA: protein of unknown function DUF4352 [Caudoviricetes sp.]